MPAQTWIVIGANRGIGLSLVREIHKRHPEGIVYATARDVSAATELNALAAESKGHVVPIQADFNDVASIKHLAEQLKKTSACLDHVIISAGGPGARGPIETMPAADIASNFATNVLGPHNAVSALYPLVEASSSPKRTIAFVSSSTGSMASVKETAAKAKKIYGLDHFPLPAYAVSKSALNMLARQWALQLEEKGIAVVVLHPGNVATDGTKAASAAGGSTLIPPSESAEGLINVISNLDIKGTDRGLHCYDGAIMGW